MAAECGLGRARIPGAQVVHSVVVAADGGNNGRGTTTGTPLIMAAAAAAAALACATTAGRGLLHGGVASTAVECAAKTQIVRITACEMLQRVPTNGNIRTFFFGGKGFKCIIISYSNSSTPVYV